MGFPTQSSLGIGTKLEYETTPGASPIAYTVVSEVLDIPPLPHSREFVEATNQDSQDGYREYIAGLKDAEEVTFECNYLPQDATHIALKAMYESGDARYWRVREATTSPEKTLTFLAIVASWSPSMPVGDKKVLSVTLRRTGPSVLA